jgi:HAMP domain-containing protein
VSATEARRRGFGLTPRIFVAIALVVVAVLGGTLVATAILARRNAEAALDRRLANTNAAALGAIEAENDKLARAAAVAALNTPIVSLLVGGDESSVVDQALTMREIVGADYLMVTDNRGILKVRTDDLSVRGIPTGGPLIGGALEGRQVAGFVNLFSGRDSTRHLYLAVATPLADLASGVVQAVLVVTHEVNDSLAGEIKRATDSDIVFYALDDDDNPVIVASTLPRTVGLDTALRTAVAWQGAADSAAVRAEVGMGGQRSVGYLRPLANPGGSPLAGFLALRSLDQELVGYRRLQRFLLVVSGVGLLLALVAALVVARQIVKPVRALVGVTRRVAEGDYSAQVPVMRGDEIGELAGAFRQMVDELRAKQQLVEYLTGSPSTAITQPVYTAGGDLASPTMVRSAAAGTGMLAVGQVLAGRYDIKSILGMGGMGVVYRAMDRELGEPVAIKTLRGEALAADPALLQRFRDEIRLARKITHRNVVRTHDIGEIEGMYYITMEFVEGQSLKHLIQSRGSLPLPVALTVGKQLCRALEAAHEQGVIHRDIKPQNLVVEPSGILKVMDFGIARLAVRSEGVTQAGMAIGTPEYMAPEQLLGDNVDIRVDIYAAGCVLFECVTGRTPFVADSPITLVAKQLEETPPSPSSINSAVPEPLAGLILRALSKDAAARPQSAAELHDLLDSMAA